MTPASFANERLWSQELRTLLPKIEVVADPEFTEAYDRVPVKHRTRVTVVLGNGEHVRGYAGGEEGDLSQSRSDAEIEESFCPTHDALTRQGADAALAMLWRLDAMPDVTAIRSFSGLHDRASSRGCSGQGEIDGQNGYAIFALLVHLFWIRLKNSAG